MASLFSLHEIMNKNMLINPNYVDWLKNLQIRSALKKNSDVLDIPNPGSISNNKKAKKISMDIIYGKFEC